MYGQAYPTGSSLAASVPPEILLQIFTESTPQLYKYDPSIIQGPNSSWLRKALRTKKSLPLVCRAWHAPATEILYSDVVLRRSGQIIALADTLRTTAPGTQEQGGSAERDLAPLIRRIRMDNLVVLSPHSDAIQVDFAYILDQAVRLAAFEYRPHPAFPVHDDIEQQSWNRVERFNPGWMFRCAHLARGDAPEPPNPVADAFHARLRSPAMRELDLMSTEEIHRIWECSEAIIHIHDILRSAADNLVTLKLGILSIGRYGTLVERYSSPLVFTALEELWWGYEDMIMMEYVLKAWVLPRLARLTLLACPLLWPEALLKVHGRSLKYLHMYPGRVDESPDRIMQPFEASTLVRQCPILQHLILPAPPAQLLSLQHPSLCYLDVWSSTTQWIRFDKGRTPDENVRAAILDETQCSLPALRAVRVLLAPGPQPTTVTMPYHLPAGRHPGWPVVCHPEALLSGSTGARNACYRVFSSSWALQLSWGVVSLSHQRFLQQHILPGGRKEDHDAETQAGPADAPDELGPDPEMLRAILEEQGLEYSDAVAEADYVPQQDESASESESDMELCDPEELAGLSQPNRRDDDGRAPQIDRAVVLEGFRRGLLAGMVSDSDEEE